MARMVNFKLNRECREISVNPARVLYVCHYEHGAASIHFGKDCQVRVQGSVSDVSAKIEAALHDFEVPTNPSQSPDELKRAGVN